MKILITGSAGFLGHHLASRFLAHGCEVVGIDNYLTGTRENTDRLLAQAGFSFVEHDISEPFSCDTPLDGILHFASPASPIDYLRLPIQTLKVGSKGTLNALGIARRHQATLLLASTSEVYGDPRVHPQPESYWGCVNPVGPRGVYDEAKRFAEALTMAYHRYHGVDVRIARIFNTYGPGMRLDDGRVISNFLVQALRGQPLTIYGNGEQTRSFCHVDDMVEGIFQLFFSDLREPVNLGNPSEYSIRDLADLIDTITGHEHERHHEPLPEDDPRIRQPDISLAIERLGWAPRIDLEQGLRSCLPHFSKRLSPAAREEEC